MGRWCRVGFGTVLLSIGDIDKMKMLIAFYVAMESPLLVRKRK